MKKLITLAALLAVCACSVDPQAAAQRRQALIQSIFPSKADQQGIHLLFPIESGGFGSRVEVIYFDDQVTQQEIIRRTANYCAKHTGETFAKVHRAAVRVQATLVDGSKRAAKQIWLDCKR